MVTDEGISRWDGTALACALKAPLGPLSVKSCLADGSGALWVASQKGLLRFAGGRLRHFTAADGIPNDDIRILLEDRQGNLWIGTLGGGLLRYAAGEFSRLSSAEGFLGDQVEVLYEDRVGSLWAGTDDGGLHRLMDGKFTVIGKPEGLSHDKVRVIHEDRAGNLWIGTDGGLNLFKDGKFRVYTTQDGLPSKEVYEIHKDVAGMLWLGVVNGGLSRFDGEKFTNYTSKDGLYNDGVWNEEGAAWSFQIHAHFYQTSWFFTLALLVATTLAVAGYQWRMKSFAKRQRELALLVEERTRELEEARLQAEGSNRAKTEFLSNMSHELRTPMTAIIGFSEVLEDQFFGPLTPKQREHIANILSSARHLLSLINDILDLAKVEAGRMELEVNQFVPRNLLISAMTMVRERAHKQGVTLDMVPGAGSDWVAEADERKIKQILFNLLSNAVKFTPKGKVVRIGARMSAPHPRGDGKPRLVLSVEDQGIGIRQEDLPRLFKPFTQLESAYTKRFEGTGLGLALTHKLVELHGGQIRVESRVDAGSTFTVEIPVSLPAGWPKEEDP